MCMAKICNLLQWYWSLEEDFCHERRWSHHNYVQMHFVLCLRMCCMCKWTPRSNCRQRISVDHIWRVKTSLVELYNNWQKPLVCLVCSWYIMKTFLFFHNSCFCYLIILPFPAVTDVIVGHPYFSKIICIYCSQISESQSFISAQDVLMNLNFSVNVCLWTNKGFTCTNTFNT